MKTKKNIAVLSTMYYPDMGAPSACFEKYRQSLETKYNFYIITKTYIPYSSRYEKSNVTYISNWRHKWEIKCHDNLKKSRKRFISILSLSFIKLWKLIATQILFPSYQKWEINAYYHALQKLNDEIGVDVVIPVSNNFVTQLATLRFKRECRDIKWIAFITDPYSEFYIYYKYKILKRLWKNRNLKKEQEIYNECDAIMVTSEMYRYIPAAFNLDISKLYKIEFTLNNKCPQTAETKTIVSTNSDTCKMIFAGTFYKTIRNPEFMLRTLSNTNNIKLDLFVSKGECEDIINAYVGDDIKRYEYVDYETYLRHIYYDYDILINVGNNASLQAPSKMLELLSTGKPILNFYFSKDSQYEMIEKYPLGLNISKDDPKAVSEISNFCKSMKGETIPFSEVEKLFPDNNLESQVNVLRSLIEG